MIVDGAIIFPDPRPPLAPGFDLEKRKDAIYEWVRQIRGGVLAGSSTVERNLSGLIMLFFLGDRIQMETVQDAFEDCVLNPMTFERRINAVATIATHLIGAEAAKALAADLGELKSLRNAMAHQPHWYQTQVNEAGELISLVPFIRKGKQPLPMTSPWVEEMNAKMRKLIDETTALAEAAASRVRAESRGASDTARRCGAASPPETPPPHGWAP